VGREVLHRTRSLVDGGLGTRNGGHVGRSRA
jgi:hypothetical protein